MNQKQFEQISQNRLISACDLLNQSPRTLIYGSTLEGHDFHVYLGFDGDIYVLTSLRQNQYDHLAVLDVSSGSSGGVGRNIDFAPGIVANPEFSDFEFCTLLKERGVTIHFADLIIEDKESTPKAFGNFYARTYEPKGSEFYCSAREILRDLTTSNHDRLLEEAAASIECEILSDRERRAFLSMEKTQVVRQQAKLMLYDPRVASNLHSPKGIDLRALLGLCLKLPQGEWDVAESSTMVGGTIIYDIFLSAPSINAFKEIQRSPESFEKNYGFITLSDSSSEPYMDALVGQGFDGMPGLAILYNPRDCSHLTIVDRLFGNHEVFGKRLSTLIGRSLNFQ